MEVCVCVLGADGRVGRVQIPAGWATHGPRMSCCVRFVSSRKEKGEERVGVITFACGSILRDLYGNSEKKSYSKI
jgi:hypothetical protein